MDRRLRVLLSNARKGLQTAGVKNYVQFGIKSEYVPWANRFNEQLEALQLKRVVTSRHRFIEHFTESL